MLHVPLHVSNIAEKNRCRLTLFMSIDIQARGKREPLTTETGSVLVCGVSCNTSFVPTHVLS